MKKEKTTSSCFGNHRRNWICPVCQYLPQAPLVACPECGCHILLLVKARRLAQQLAEEKKDLEALAVCSHRY